LNDQRITGKIKVKIPLGIVIRCPQRKGKSVVLYSHCSSGIAGIDSINVIHPIDERGGNESLPPGFGGEELLEKIVTPGGTIAIE